MTISLHIVTWNSKRFLPALFRSIDQQTRKPDRILVVDNASIDGTLELLEHLPRVYVLRNTRNLGFSRGHNQAIHLSTTDAVLITNPDIIFEPTCVEELARALQENRRIASVAPKLLRFSFSSDDLSEPIRSATIDAAGMVMLHSRQVVNRGEGQGEAGQFNKPTDVFGAPGTLALFSRTALEDVAVNGEYFDEDFFAYKEDADLAWRLQLAGWRARYVPSARAYHHRTLYHHGDRLSKIVSVRRDRSSLLRTLSYRNHLLMLFKNETLGTFLAHAPFILWYELKKFIFILFREWPTLRGFVQALRMIPRMARKRRAFADRRRLPWRTMIVRFKP